MEGHFGSDGRGRGFSAIPVSLLGLRLVSLYESAVPRHWRRIAVLLCATALAWVLLGAGQAWSGAASPFTKLTAAGQSLTEARSGAVAASLPDGQVLIAGGYNPPKSPAETVGSDFSSAELFNPATDTFSKLTGAASRSPKHATARSRRRCPPDRS